MIKFQETLPRVIVHISNNIPIFEEPIVDHTLHKLVYSHESPETRETHEKLDYLQNMLDPIVDETGFFRKTVFQHLFISFTLDTNSQLKHKITLRSSKADRDVSIHRIFLKEDLLPALQGDFVSFALEHVRDMLAVLCKKYDLNSQPLNKLSQKEDHSQAITDNQLADSVIEQCKDNELRIHIRLSDDQFGGLNEIDGHAQFVDELEQLLEERDLGRIDGSELGMGYRDIYCAGDDANAMYECIAERLKLVPFGSYIEIVKDGEIKRIELGARASD